MKSKLLPLKKMSIGEIYNGEKTTYEVPIYQRNYAWEKDEISALIQDVYDAFKAQKRTYYIGTLVSFHRGEQVYEVIDGQQRLTTINLILVALGIHPRNKLTYRVRQKSNDTIRSMPDFQIEERDYGIVSGYGHAQEAIGATVPRTEQRPFTAYFQHNVQLIHYQVPKDIDLNHYFEIMNSRGEQLEKHEIIKARLYAVLNSDTDKAKFSLLWEICSEMNVYVQQRYADVSIFGKDHCDFEVSKFDDLPEAKVAGNRMKIVDIIGHKSTETPEEKKERIDSFQPIIDFSNFLLIVLKLTRSDEKEFDPVNFNLDDKDLLREFDKVPESDDFTKKFGFNLLKARFLLDNYVVHHSNEDDSLESNPWKLQYWYKEPKKNGYLRNLSDDAETQDRLVQLLSMFEVSFTARQRKNYLFYCLLHLFRSADWDIGQYAEFLSNLAEKYLNDVYLATDNLNEINTPKPGSFDGTILLKNQLDLNRKNKSPNFAAIYGDGTIASKGISLFVFNYLDYKLWAKYAYELRGEKAKEGGENRNAFFSALGCSDFGLKVFKHFYFSRTRRSLEHYYPQANANGENGAPNQAQINCFGNYAMIGSQANSSGSNWSPRAKRIGYLDSSRKIMPVSVASIKFMIMMQKCKDNEGKSPDGHEWVFDDMKAHQEKMTEVLMGRS